MISNKSRPAGYKPQRNLKELTTIFPSPRAYVYVSVYLKTVAGVKIFEAKVNCHTQLRYTSRQPLTEIRDIQEAEQRLFNPVHCD